LISAFFCTFFLGRAAPVGAEPKPVLTPAPTPVPTPSPSFSPIASLLKKEVLRRALKDRDVMTSAKLEKIGDSERKHYRFYAVMKVNASPKETRRILTQYDLYEKMIPYVSISK